MRPLALRGIQIGKWEKAGKVGKGGMEISPLSHVTFCHICGTIKESSGRRRRRILASMRKVGKNRLRDSIESL